MDKILIRDLLRKYRKGECSEAEMFLLETWYFQYNEEKVYHLDEAVNQPVRYLPSGLFDFRHVRSRLWIWNAAALFVMVCGIGFVLYGKWFHTHKGKRNEQFVIAPGGSKASLTLADGQKVDLAKASVGELINQGDMRINKTADGRVIYSQGGNRQPRSKGWNSITTPTGGIWSIGLPDGTTVWLNNQSSLKYPVDMVGQSERVVELHGEAYFEVSRDRKHPFIVKSNDQVIRVFGTHFNVRAFDDECETRTTLLEGKIGVQRQGSRDMYDLRPGRQSVLKKDQLKVSEVDVSRSVAWKNGYFKFDNTPIDMVMRELARWYDVDIVYDGKIPDIRLTGRMSRSKDILQVLDELAATRTLQFKFKGRRVVVMN